MIEFFAQNWGTILIGGLVALCIILAIMKLRKDKKAGQSSCGCGCSKCPNSEMCHKA